MAKSDPDCPLFPHQNGQYAKKIKGKLYYFGTDKDKAVATYLEKKDYLHAGIAPPAECDTIGHLLDAFMEGKKQALDAGELATRTFKEYETVCDIIAETIGKRRAIDHLAPADFTKLRRRLSTKLNGEPASPVSVKRLLTFARMPFYFANEELGTSIKYKKALRTPPAKAIRAAREAIGERLFTPDDIQKIVKAATPPLRAMTLLGINCGFGPADCRQVPIEALDLVGGWQTFSRPKTGVKRRCPLWPSTAAALQAVIGERTSGPVFEGCWNRHVVARAFQALCIGTGVYREGVTTFYSLRRTFETVATASEVPQAIINAIMGHAEHDIPAVYRQKVFDEQLKKCVNFVGDWTLGRISLV
ncbi:tyrosine-type recombinase/integrase [Lacipirellula sp.]|uniref:tyrosine-type recombinase/integrase n=1 Tax=Lacipirellula sp. TaxID=2691419 RepID=UPI003D1193F3